MLTHLLALALMLSTAAPAPEPEHLFAVVTLACTWEETTNLGGEHALFAFTAHGGGLALHAHAGGHGRWLGLRTRAWTAAGEARPQEALGGPRVFVAKLRLRPTSWPNDDVTAERFGSARWCFGNWPEADADVLGLWEAPDRATAEAVKVVAQAAARAIDVMPPPSRRLLRAPQGPPPLRVPDE